uniref:Uncharacterized protein n=1 Tax=Glossina palpalis gambiensis TaxID=67801 RepID=A0A1B0C083_9MUSC
MGYDTVMHAPRKVGECTWLNIRFKPSSSLVLEHRVINVNAAVFVVVGVFVLQKHENFIMLMQRVGGKIQFSVAKSSLPEHGGKFNTESVLSSPQHQQSCQRYLLYSKLLGPIVILQTLSVLHLLK